MAWLCRDGMTFYAMDIEREIDLTQIMASSKAIADLVDQESSKGIPSERIIIAGFSQGGAVAIQSCTPPIQKS